MVFTHVVADANTQGKREGFIVNHYPLADHIPEPSGDLGNVTDVVFQAHEDKLLSFDTTDTDPV